MHSEFHNLDTLRALLESLSREEYPQDVAVAAEAFRDCRLEIIRLGQVQLSDDQLHRLRQMDYRLQMVVSGHGVPSSIANEAKRTLAAFGWAAS